jgi:hypothetical protein
MEFVVEKSPKIKVRIYGEDYDLTKPTHKVAKELAKKIKGIDESEAYDMISDYLVGLGLPGDVLENMEADHVLKLCDFLAPKKN